MKSWLKAQHSENEDRWGNSGNSVRLYFFGSKITTDGSEITMALHGNVIITDGSHEIKKCLLLGRKVTNLDSILKSRAITLPTKVHLVKAYGFSSCHVWM